MKQKLIITLCAVMAFALAACTPEATNTNTNTANTANANTAMNNDAMNTDAMNADDANKEGMKDGENPKVGGADMSKDKTIVENASAASNLTTLVKAVGAAGLVDTLKGTGPFTVFAPTNDAFDKVPKDALADLMKPENKEKLAGILKYHVVSGKMDAAAIADAIKKGDGKATLKTVQGEELTASMDGDKVIVTDAKGGKATVTTANVMQSNGVVHVIDSVLMPK